MSKKTYHVSVLREVTCLEPLTVGVEASSKEEAEQLAVSGVSLIVQEFEYTEIQGTEKPLRLDPEGNPTQEVSQ